jgi:hypothetical protein
MQGPPEGGRYDRGPTYRRGRPLEVRGPRSRREGRDPPPCHDGSRDQRSADAGKHTPERCLDAAFRFLLDRESKESILGRYDVTVISRYLPEFERELPRYLSQS